MGLYNMVFGTDPRACIVLKLLGLAPDDFGRFRDAWFETNENGEPVLAVYTRCGGNNRSHCQAVFDTMREHPLYLEDWDDTFDETYCTFRFKAPEDANARLVEIIKEIGLPPLPEGWTLKNLCNKGREDTDKNWQNALEALKSE